MQKPSNKPAHLQYTLRSSDRTLLEPLVSERALRKQLQQAKDMASASASSTASTAASTASSSTLSSSITAFAKVSDGASLSPPVYTGTENAHVWIRYFKAYTKFRKYTDADALAIFELLMRDAAHTWFIQLPDTAKATYENLEKEFLDRFANRECQQWQVIGDLFQRQQGSKESVDSYVEAMQRDFKHAQVEDTNVLLHAVVRGLRPNIRYCVLQANCKTIAELVNTARLAEQAATTMPSDNAASTLALHDRLADVASEVRELASTVKALKVTPVQQPRSPRPDKKVRFRRTQSVSPVRRPQDTNGQATRQPTSFSNNLGYAAQGRNPPQSLYPQNSACFTCGDVSHKYRQCPFNTGRPTVPSAPKFVRPRGPFQPQFRAPFNSFNQH